MARLHIKAWSLIPTPDLFALASAAPAALMVISIPENPNNWEAERLLDGTAVPP